MSHIGQAAAVAGAAHDRRWVALYVLCAGMLMIVLDVTVVNVALPSIQDELHFSTSSLAWVVNAYLIAFGGLLLLAGRFGDLIGRRRIFLAGVGLFTVASLACGLADSQSLLIAARFVQGIGGAMTSAVILGMIVTMFPEPREQAKAIGVYAFVASAGGSVGLLAGGVITQSIDWHWIFFVNIPIGIATAVFARRLLERDPGIGLSEGADVPGAVLITAALMLGVYTIVKPAAEDGWGAGRTLALGGASLALLLGFLVREATARNPLMPLRIFRSRNVASANLDPDAVRRRHVRHVLPRRAVPSSGARLRRAADRARVPARHARHGYAVDPLLRAAGHALRRAQSARAGPRADRCSRSCCSRSAPVTAATSPDVLPSMLLLGIGAGVCFPALMNVAMAGARPQDAGLASGLVNTTAQVGGALGLAVLATLSASRSDHLLAHGSSTAAALTGGYHLAFWIAAALVAASIAIVPVVLTQSAQNSSAVCGPTQATARFSATPPRPRRPRRR